jgi:hypothetical protein
MRKFDQKLNQVKSDLQINENILLEADNIGFFSSLYHLLPPSTRLWIKPHENFNANNVYYLVGGSKTLPTMYEKFNIAANTHSLESVTKEQNAEEAKIIEGITKLNNEIRVYNSKVNHDPQDTASQQKLTELEGNLKIETEKLKKLEADIKKIAFPFDENGEIKTPDTEHNIGSNYQYGYTTLPILLYNAFSAAITTQKQNYFKITELLDQELRSRKRYSVKLDIRSSHYNLSVTHDRLMTFLKNGKYSKVNTGISIMYLTEADAKNYQKDEDRGNILQRGMQAADTSLMNYLKSGTTSTL